MEVEFETTSLWQWAEYDSIIVQSETDNYRLQVSGYQGNAEDALDDQRYAPWAANMQAFSTPERDNDIFGGGNCAGDRQNGWWYGW